MAFSTVCAAQTEARLDQPRAPHLQGGFAADLRLLCRSWGIKRSPGAPTAGLFCGRQNFWLPQLFDLLEQVYAHYLQWGSLAARLGCLNSIAKLVGLYPKASAQALQAINAAPLSH